MSHKLHWFIMVMLTVYIYGSSFSYVQAKANDQVILILINQLSFNDLPIYKDISGFDHLELEGAKAALNINSGGKRSDANSYLSIGGGSRGNGVKGMGDSYLGKEKIDVEGQHSAKEIYEQLTGRIIRDKNLIIFLPIEHLLRVQVQRFPFKIGALGAALKSTGLTSKVYGNNDTNKKTRYGPLITMDQEGINKGDIGVDTLITDLSRPYGIKTNYSYFLNQLKISKDEGVSLVVFDLGDIYRLEQFGFRMNADYKESLRKEVIQEAGSFIDTIIHQLEINQTLIVMSPMVNEKSIREKKLLSPLWIYNKNQQGNLLISGTTKREGIVANIDIAPTILELLNIKEKPSEMLGQSINVLNSNLNLAEELQHIFLIYKLRPTVIYGYVLWQVFILVASMLVWIRKKRTFFIWAQIGLLGMLYLPLLMLLTSFWTSYNAYFYLMTIIMVSLFLGWLTNYLKPVKAFLIIGLITFLTITIDILLGGPFIKRSFLGYDPIIGARYYGIGNEYMGIYIGATLLFSASLLQLKKDKFKTLLTALTAIIYIGIIFILLYPTLGTNAGGAISAIFGTGYAFLKIIRFNWNKKSIIFIGLILLTFLSMIAAINFIVPLESQSHIGRALNLLFEGNLQEIVKIIQRKLAINWKLLQVSSWSKVMLTSIFAIIILFIKPKGTLIKLKKKYQYVFYGFQGIVVGAIISLLVNDSGIVAASTMIIYVAIPMIYFSLINQKEPKS